ncbi:MAG TPA: cation:proton antiporter [Xanthobacteraceae bacterium]|nr:cation:proton antiporter [Xanthobacteraceae bacterium]
MFLLLRGGFYAAAIGVLTAIPAYAAETPKGPSEAVFVIQILLLLIVGRLLGELMLRLGQPAVVGQLVAGLLLGPSFFGLLAPDLQHAIFPRTPEQKAMIDAVSQFGILLLLLLTGMETDLKLVRQSGRASLFASLMGIVVPFACGVTLGEFVPDSMLPDPSRRLITALFLGTALSIASVKIVAVVVREMNFLRRVVGQVILASAIIDDSIGWIIVSIIFSVALHGAVDGMALTKSVVGTFLFMAVSFSVGRRVVFLIIRWANDVFVSEFAVITAILIVMGAMALITDAIGVHMVLGAFVAGILVGQSPILTRHIDEQLRGIITAFFAPIFFGIAGLSADLSILSNLNIALLTGGLILIASIGKFTGAFIGAELGGLTRREGFALACGMNARGSTEVIVATIGLSMGALNQDLFTMIVTMAIVTTMAMPPMLRWALSRLPMSKAERERLRREKLDEKGFVANLERLLIAIDDSANGKFASRIAGIIAGTRGMPSTVVPLNAKAPKNGNGAKKERKDEQPEHKGVEHAVKSAAAASARRKAKDEENKEIDVTVRTPEKAPHDAIAEEADKGYDLLVIGLEKTVSRKAELHAGVNRIGLGFEGALAVVDSRGIHVEDPLESKLSILVPVNGTIPSRNAADVALAIAKAIKAPVTVLYVATRAAVGKKRRLRKRHHEKAILKDIMELAQSYGVKPQTAILADIAPEEAILKQVDVDKNTLIVMGASRRPGEKLFFGDTAAAVLENSKASVLLISS